MVDLTFRHTPATLFGPNRERKPSPFSARYDRTLDDLDEELGHLEAVSAFGQLVFAGGEADLRQDGKPRARALVTHPGVSLTIVTARLGTLVYSCDEFETRWSHQGESWQANLRAIVVGLHDLRRLDRYGIAKRGQQYAGFRELGSGTVVEGERRSRQDVADWLARKAGLRLLDTGIERPATLTWVAPRPSSST